MSRESVNQIIARAAADETFFELLRSHPDQAVDGYELSASETSAFRAGAYNVLIRSARQNRAEEAQRLTAAIVGGGDRQSNGQGVLRSSPAPSVSTPLAALAGFLIGAVVVAAGLGGYRYVEKQWPWQTAGVGRAAASASVGSVAGAASRATQQPSTNEGGAAGTVGQAPPPEAVSSPPPSSSTAADSTARNYYQAVGTRLAAFLNSFNAAYDALEAGKDSGRDLQALPEELAALKRQMAMATPPAQLKEEHRALAQALPVLQADVDLMKSAVSQHNNDQAKLIASQMNSLLEQIPDEVTFAMEAHPELYQPIETNQRLAHALNFDIMSQNVTRRGYATPEAVLQIAIQKAAPSPDEVADSAHQAVIEARRSYPQATHIRIVAYSETNGEPGGQVGSADWFCGADSRPPGSNPNSRWQDDCGKVYISTSIPGSAASSRSVGY